MVVVDHNSAMAFSRNQDPSETFELGAGHQRPLLSPVAAAPEHNAPISAVASTSGVATEADVLRTSSLRR
jgi:hypothetical protein